MKGYCTMPYGYLTDPQLARDFWAIYTVEPDATGTQTVAGGRRPAKTDDGQEEDDDAGSAPRPSAERGCWSFDRGPSQAIASICLRCPRPGKPKAFWTAWGPIFYRGRLDGSARLLCIASDPGPTERIAHRTLVGDAGQRVQGFLAKLGLTTSYLCVNAFPYALHPSYGHARRRAARGPMRAGVAATSSTTPSGRTHVEAVVAFGANAQKAFELWHGQAERAGRADPASEQP